MEPIDELIFHDLLSSSESSGDDEFDVRGPINLLPKIQNYVENIVNGYSDEDFRKNFRLSRETFESVLELIENRISYKLYGRPTLSAKSQFCVGLWYLATPDSYRSVCGRFGIGKATGLRTVRRVVDALFELSPTVIKWPNAETCEQIVEGFTNAGFPNTIGAIDGCHIPIPQPKEHGISYINRKNFASLVLQGVCDDKMKFIHCYAGEVGSSHDARVLKKSKIWQKILNHEDCFEGDRHLIGDKAYPCIAELLTPYRDNGHLTRAQRQFNYNLSTARSVIERAFGLLKRRFRILKCLDVICMNWAPKYIIACCVLHNICMMNNELEVRDGEIDPHDELVDEDDVPFELNVNHNRLHLGQQKRNRLCNELFNQVE